jgi:hypothetical protein
MVKNDRGTFLCVQPLLPAEVVLKENFPVKVPKGVQTLLTHAIDKTRPNPLALCTDVVFLVPMKDLNTTLLDQVFLVQPETHYSKVWCSQFFFLFFVNIIRTGG